MYVFYGRNGLPYNMYLIIKRLQIILMILIIHSKFQIMKCFSQVKSTRPFPTVVFFN